MSDLPHSINSFHQSTEYWRQELKETDSTFVLPFIQQGGLSRSFTRKDFELQTSLVESLRKASKGNPETLSLFLLTALSVAFSRYSGESRVPLWFPAAKSENDTEAGFRRINFQVQEEEVFIANFRALESALSVAARQNAIPAEQLDPASSAFRYPALRNGHQVVYYCDAIHQSPGRPAFAQLLIGCHLNGEGIQLELAGENLHEALAADFVARFSSFLQELFQRKELPAGSFSFWHAPDEEKTQTYRPADIRDQDILVRRFETWAQQHPADEAVRSKEQTLSFGELNQAAEHIAATILHEFGLKPGTFIGLMMSRGPAIPAAIMGIWKAGCVYVPIDMTLPDVRKEFMLTDSGVQLLLTDDETSGKRAKELGINYKQIRQEALAAASAAHVSVKLNGSDAAYLIYTSGSTGTPKGVLVSQQNLAGFSIAMDHAIGPDPGHRLLAATSVSFDISILELCWTLSRGISIQVAGDQLQELEMQPAADEELPVLDFSIFYFSSYNNHQKDGKYHLLLESAKLADESGFTAIWTPERHFNEFGGLYPNPSVTSAALSMITRRMRIRSGSVVSPLHHPVRIAEEWSVVDNLSEGRVELAFASGWHKDDFVLIPGNFGKRQEIMYEQIEAVRKLWKGEKLAFVNGNDERIEVATFPRPVQDELPVWITAAGSPDTFRSAGKIGANLLTHLLGQEIDELQEKISIYRQSLKENGFDPATRKVSLMLHTYIGEDQESVKNIVRQPFKEYLKSSLGLAKRLVEESKIDFNTIDPAVLDKILDRAFERFYSNNALFGTVSSVIPLLARLKKLGVDEIACLADFGVDEKLVLSGMSKLKELVRLFSGEEARSSAAEKSSTEAVVDLFQTTPTFLKMLIDRPESTPFWSGIRRVIVGGEAIDASLVRRFREKSNALLTNVYGPTEATIWCSSYAFPETDSTVFIGRPLINSRIYVLDAKGRKVPPGVTGEIVIGGDAVAIGYHNRPELTAAVFAEDPFVAGSRIYRTGDIGRWTADGLLEFLGRRDSQVKINGHRIETGEIESVLLQHEKVPTAAVSVHTIRNEKHLVAYVPLASGLTPGELRAFLAGRLPDYMVPTVFVGLGQFPVTANGKLDRKKLPLPDNSNRLSAAVDYVAPRNEQEKILAEIWSDLLQQEGIGITDNFFDRGGNSVMLVELQSRIAQRLQADFQITDLLTYPTIRDFVAYLHRQEEAAPDPELLSGYAFSEGFINPAGKSRAVRTELLSASLSGKKMEAVSSQAQQYGVSPETLLKALYAFMLMRITGVRKLLLHAVDTKQDEISAGFFDFEKENDLDGIIAGTQKGNDDCRHFSIRHLANAATSKKSGEVYAVFVNKKYYSGNPGLDTFYDLVFTARPGGHEWQITLEYNSALLSQEKMKWMLQVYSGLLEKLIETKV